MRSGYFRIRLEGYSKEKRRISKQITRRDDYRAKQRWLRWKRPTGIDGPNTINIWLNMILLIWAERFSRIYQFVFHGNGLRWHSSYPRRESTAPPPCQLELFGELAFCGFVIDFVILKLLSSICKKMNQPMLGHIGSIGRTGRCGIGFCGMGLGTWAMIIFGGGGFLTTFSHRKEERLLHGRSSHLPENWSK